jgi:hypothetical protein
VKLGVFSRWVLDFISHPCPDLVASPGNPGRQAPQLDTSKASEPNSSHREAERGIVSTVGPASEETQEPSAGKEGVTVQSPQVDLTFSIQGRTSVGGDGLRNMPDGETFTCPVEDTVDGWMQSSFPATHKGVDVGQARVGFKAGRVVKAESQKNQSHLIEIRDSDEEARRIGELGI